VYRMENPERSVKLPVFDGKPEHFQMWWTRFQAYACVYKFEKGLTVNMDLPDTAADELTADEAGKKKAAKKCNDVAMANYTMALSQEANHRLIYRAQNSDWPMGLAWKVTEALLKQYMPQDTMSRAG
jgi:hypothetical protein